MYSRIPKRIIIFGYRHIGDTLFITPAIRAIKESYPDSYLSVICGEFSSEILKDNPYIDEVTPLPNNSFKEKLKIRNYLKQKKFDTIFLFQHTFLNALFAYILGIKIRVGLNWKGCGILLTHKINYNNNWHEVDRYLNIVSLLTKKNYNNLLPQIFLKEEDEKYAEEFFKKHNLQNDNKLICINPGSSIKWKIKRWDIENYAKLANVLIEKYNKKVLVICGPYEEELITNFLRLTNNKPIVVKENSLKKLAAIIKKCKLFITNDTGPMHIAKAVGCKVIAIVGPSDIKKTGPYGKEHIIIRKELSCSPCKKQTCDDLSCLRLITPQEVLEKIEDE